MKKLPAFQFYPGDWMKDPALRAVSLAARGLWIDTLCLMFESHRRGYLVHRTGAPVSLDQLARMVGASGEEVQRLAQELEDCGVLSRTSDGVLYSRRMARDEERRKQNAKNGSLGGNPKLVGKSDNQESNPRVNREPNQPSNRNPTPSSSTSSSSSPSGDQLEEESKPARGKRFVKPTLEEARAYCQERGSVIDPEEWWHKNEAKGWLVGNPPTPMKNWKSNIITWEKNHAKYGGHPGGTGSTGRATTSPTTHAERRDAANDAAFRGFLNAHGLCPDDGNALRDEADGRLHGQADAGVVRGPRALPGFGAE
jgi:biotin operon repressor